MLRLLRFLFTGSFHEHEWETDRIIEVYTVDTDNGYRRVSDTPSATKYVLKCKICGNIKVKRV